MKHAESSFLRTCGVAAVFAMVSIGADAQTISLTNPNTAPAPGTNVGGGQLSSTNYLNNFNGGTTYTASKTGATWISDGSSTFWAYCIDPRTGTAWYNPSTGANQNVYTSTSLANFLNTGSPTPYQQQFNSSSQTSPYYGLAYAAQTNTTTVFNNLTTLYSRAYADSLTSAVKAAAFGYAVWEVIGENPTATNQNGLNPSGGYGRASGALRSNGGSTTNPDPSPGLDVQIDAYLNALNGTITWSSLGLNTVTNYIYTVYYDPAPHSAQNFLRVTTAGVPEPATLALVGVALLGATTARRRSALRG